MALAAEAGKPALLGGTPVHAGGLARLADVAGNVGTGGDQRLAERSMGIAVPANTSRSLSKPMRDSWAPSGAWPPPADQLAVGRPARPRVDAATR